MASRVLSEARARISKFAAELHRLGVLAVPEEARIDASALA